MHVSIAFYKNKPSISADRTRGRVQVGEKRREYGNAKLAGIFQRVSFISCHPARVEDGSIAARSTSNGD
ncbi:MAG: hypothetical protein M3160_02990 [Candidatus Eremiobacteraeota bacterium]|nr:hypothetical protein [Candidatus Eremiobacteraeota bacterium]